MVIRIFYIAVAIFSVAMVFLSVQTPYLSEMFKEKLSDASIEMSGITDYEIKDKIDAKIIAKRGVRYKNRDEFENLNAFVIDDSNHTLSSKKAVKKGNIVTFTGDAHYENSDNIEYISQKIIYDSDKKIVRSDVPYVLKQGENNVSGTQISYNMKTKQTKSKGIHAWYLLEEK